MVAEENVKDSLGLKPVIRTDICLQDKGVAPLTGIPTSARTTIGLTQSVLPSIGPLFASA